jgi:hypothetical protein
MHHERCHGNRRRSCLVKSSARSIRRLSSGAIGAIGAIGAAGLIVMALASAYSARPAQAVIPDQSELSAFAKAVERRGTLYGLEIMF